MTKHVTARKVPGAGENASQQIAARKHATSGVASMANLVHRGRPNMQRLNKLVVVALTGMVGCASNDTTGDGRDDSFTTDGKLDGFSCTPAEAAAILQVSNTASLSTLKNDVGLTAKAADNVVAVRKGDDELANTADDTEFGTLAQLDAVPYIGPAAFALLLQYVHDADLVDTTVPTAGQWTSATIANGTGARFAITPDNKLVLTLHGNNEDKLQLANGTLVTLPSEAQYPQTVVDASGVPHVFYRVPYNYASYQHRHMSYRNGQLVDHGILPVHDLWVDQNPSGTIFALGRDYGCTTCSVPLTLYSFQSTGTATAEPLWTVGKDHRIGFTVGDYGFPVIANSDDYDIGRHARRSASGWSRLDAIPLNASHRYIATTGGVNATVLVSNDGTIRA